MSEVNRTQGTVRWFSRVKGYGFIQPDGSEKDVFVHYSAIEGEGYRNLDEGQRVEFIVEDSSKGPQAAHVVGLARQAPTEQDSVEPASMEQDAVESAPTEQDSVESAPMEQDAVESAPMEQDSAESAPMEQVSMDVE